MDSKVKRAKIGSDPPENTSISSSAERIPCSDGDMESKETDDVPRAKMMSSKELIAELLRLLSDIEKGAQDTNASLKLQNFFKLCDQLKRQVLGNK